MWLLRVKNKVRTRPKWRKEGHVCWPVHCHLGYQQEVADGSFPGHVGVITQVNHRWGSQDHRSTKDSTILREFWNVVCTWKGDDRAWGLPFAVFVKTRQAQRRGRVCSLWRGSAGVLWTNKRYFLTKVCPYNYIGELNAVLMSTKPKGTMLRSKLLAPRIELYSDPQMSRYSTGICHHGSLLSCYNLLFTSSLG